MRRTGVFIVELAPPFERLELMDIPDTVSVPRQVNNGVVAVPGRNNPIYQYTGGSDTMNLEMFFFTESEGGVDIESVTRKVNWLKSLTYADNVNQATRKVKIVWAGSSLFQDLEWVITSVTPEYQGFHSQYNYLPVFAKVTLSFALAPDEDLKLSDFR